jgi:uncharacterized protein (TIRG00374 family)
MWQAWRTADKTWFLPAVGLFAGGLFLRAWKWRVFLNAANHRLPYLACLRAYVLNAFLGNLTPARAGEALAPIWLSRHGVPPAASLAVVVVDRVLDLLAVLSLFAFAVWHVGRTAVVDSTAIRAAGQWAGLLVGLLLVVVIIALLRLDVVLAVLARIPGRLAARLRQTLASFQQAVTMLQRRRVLATNFALTLACWLTDLTTGFLVVRGFVPTLRYLDSGAGAVFATVAAILSFIPGGLGIGAAGYAAVMALFGYDLVAAGSGAVLMTLLTHAVRATMAAVLSNAERGRSLPRTPIRRKAE